MRRFAAPILACLILSLVLSGTMSALPHSAQAADYETGIQAFMAKDFAGAARELLPLAAQGDARAQYAAGVLYQKGQGLTQNLPLAWYWYSKAEAQGHDKAAKAREQLETEMSADDLAQARQILADEMVGLGAEVTPPPPATGTGSDAGQGDASEQGGQSQP